MIINSRFAYLSKDELVAELEKTHNYIDHVKNLFELSDEIIYALDPEDYSFISINSAVEKITGLQKSDLVKSPNLFFDVIHPDDLGIFKTPIRKTTVLEYRIIVNNKIIWLKDTRNIIFDTDRKFIKYYGIIRDVTEKKQKEVELKRTENLFKMIFNQSPVSIQLHNLDGTMINSNPAWSRLWDVQDREQFFGVYNVLEDPQIQKMNITGYFERAAKGETLVIEDVCYDPSKSGHPGRKRWLRVKVAPITDNSGKVINVILIFHDITQEKSAIDELEESNERYRSILRAIPDIMFRIDKDGNYIDCHTPETSLTAADPSFLIGKNIKEIAETKEIAELTLKKIRECLDTKSLQIYEYELTVPAGRKIFEARITPSSNNEVMAIIRDVTESKKSREKLIEAQKMDSIGNLAGGVAHDFNNMLGGILGFASLLKMEEKNTLKKEYIDCIITAVNRSSELTNKLLAFGRRGKFLIQPVNIISIVKEVLSILRYSISKSIEIETDFDKNVYTVDADSSQMNQIILNLAVNASDAMGINGTLSFKVFNTELDSEFCKNYDVSAGAYVGLSVKDTGAGIDPSIKKHIFEPFFTTKKDGNIKGTGLGLATTYGIVKSHKGIIDFNSEVGKGTEFIIYLPKGSKKKIDKKVSQPAVQNTKTACILIVEDEEIIRKMLGRMVTTLGYKIIEASDGLEAVSSYKEYSKEIDLVILDMKMPVLGGKETILKILEMNPDAKVILSTGYGKNSEAQEILDLGAVDIISKPYKIEEVALKISQQL